MVRISDILKRKGQFPEPEPDKDKEKEKPTSISSSAQTPPEGSQGDVRKSVTPPTEGINITKAMSQEQTETESRMQLAKAMHQTQLDPKESHKIYNRAMETIKHILDNVTSSAGAIDLTEASETVKTIVDRIVLGDEELISLVTNYSEENYLLAHSVNVCIICIDVGLGLGYNKSKLNELGLGAFLHDIGMIKVIALAEQPRKLTLEESTQIKKHPVHGGDILKTVKDIEEGVISIVKQHHERLNQKGYPEGLEDQQIYEYAKVVAIADTYEALTHPRPHRQALSPDQAIRELSEITSSGIFKTEIIKTLINRIGLYPVGSWVELNTGEIGKVISSNEDFPLRPKVNIIFGPDRERLVKIKSIDLSNYTNVYIKQSVNLQKLHLE